MVRSAWHWKSNSPSAVLTLLTRLVGNGTRKGEVSNGGRREGNAYGLLRLMRVSIVGFGYFFFISSFFSYGKKVERSSNSTNIFCSSESSIIYLLTAKGRFG